MCVSSKFEKEAAAESIKAVLNEYKGRFLPPNHQFTQLVAGVADRIVSTAGLGNVKGVAPGGAGDWEVFVIADDKNANAFVIPGKLLTVTSYVKPR